MSIARGVAPVGLMMVMAVGCATSVQSRGQQSEARETRVEPSAPRALAVGPGVLHAYPEGSSGALSIVKVKKGDDSDCLQAQSGRRVVSGNRLEVKLEADEMACASTERRRGLQIAWHMHPAGIQPTAVVATR